MKKILLASSVVIAGFALSASAHDDYDLKAECKAYVAANGDTKTDCSCLTDKAEADEATMTEFERFTKGEDTELGEKAMEVVAQCQKGDAE